LKKRYGIGRGFGCFMAEKNLAMIPANFSDYLEAVPIMEA
jgi:hypothetical protein